MRIEKVTLDEISRKTLDIGFMGEKNHTQVQIVCAVMFDNYPNAVATMVAKPPQGDLYPVILTRDGNKILWDVSESDIAYAGSGSFQLTFTDGSGDSAEIIKTVYGNYVVKPSMQATGEPPEPIEDWLAEAQEVLSDLQSFDNISASATTLAAGSSATAEITEVEGHKNIALGIPTGASGEMTVETVTGSTPSITGESNHRYVCGEVASISITAPESGIIDVVFESGTTPAVLTASGITFPAWFDSTTLEASVTYEICVADGMGVVAKWA